MSEEARAAAEKSLSRIQAFDPHDLAQVERLGQAMGFQEAVEPGQRLIDLYRRLHLSALDDLPDQQLAQVTTTADADYSRFQQILGFDPHQNNAAQQRTGLIQQVTNTYAATFNVLHHLIAYSLYRTADFTTLENEGRAAVQSIHDETETLRAGLERTRREAEAILEDVRKAAAEQGVSQQASYFQSEGETHDNEAKKWFGYTWKLAAALAALAIVSIFMHKIAWLAPNTGPEAAQLIAGKVLVFAIGMFVLYLFARTFQAHRHNAVVNKHRQNALMTYKALVDAAGDSANREVVLLQAAICIFSPQSSGYMGAKDASGVGGKSVVELLAKPFSDGGTGHQGWTAPPSACGRSAALAGLAASCVTAANAASLTVTPRIATDRTGASAMRRRHTRLLFSSTHTTSYYRPFPHGNGLQTIRNTNPEETTWPAPQRKIRHDFRALPSDTATS